MSQLFISYSRKDKNLAEYLVNELEQSGHNVFIDNKDISSGEQWRTTIVKAIESADVFLVLLSMKSLKSDEVRRELDIAIELKIPILPLELEPVTIPTDFKYQLAGLERHDLYTDFDSGVEALLQLPLLVEGQQRESASTEVKESTGRGAFIGRILICLTMLAAAAVIYYSSLNQDSLETVHRSPFAVYLMLCGSIYAAFNLTELLLKKNVLWEIAQWIMGTHKRADASAWTMGFIKLFDSVFAVNRSVRGVKIPSFLRSCIASFLFAFLLLGVITFSGVELIVYELNMFPDSWASNGSWGAVVEALSLTILLSVFFNVIPDYFSLIETRFILQKLQNVANLRNTIRLLLLDVIFTLLIAFIGSVIANFLFPLVNFVVSGFDTAKLAEWMIPYNTLELFQVYGVVLNIVDPADVKGSDSYKHLYYCAVFIYSTFLTSIWIWLYTLSGVLTRASISSKTLKRFITETFRVNDKPLSVLGLICISIVSIVFWGVHWASR
jgi:hypothetical protein